MFNGAGVDLQKPLHTDGTVDFITWDTEEGRRVYVRSLLFLFLYAIKKLRPEVQLEVCNSIGSALYCDITNGIVLSKYDLQAVELYMRKLIQADCFTGADCLRHYQQGGGCKNFAGAPRGRPYGAAEQCAGRADADGVLPA